MLLQIQPQATLRPGFSILILILGMMSYVEPLSTIAYPKYRNNHDRRRESFGLAETSPLPYPSPSLWRNDTSSFLDYPRFSLSSLRKPTLTHSPQQKFRVFCDLDGVLVDFCHGISQAFPDDAAPKMNSQNVDAIPRSLLWDRVKSADAFFEHLPWCEGGRELWEAIEPLRPNILTGVPSYCDRAPRDEKFAWCLRELATDRLSQFQHIDKAGRLRQHYPVKNEIVQIQHESSLDIDWTCRVITCWSERKHHESGKNAVLIDDRIDLKAAWEAAGGIFIHHTTGNTGATLRQLRERGILSTVRP